MTEEDIVVRNALVIEVGSVQLHCDDYDDW